MIMPAIFLAAMFLIYYYLNFELIDTLLEKPKLKKVYRIPVGIINTCIIALAIGMGGRSAFSFYSVFGLILFVEFFVFYRDKPARVLFCTLACMLYVIAIHSICIAIFAIINDKTLFEIANKAEYMMMSLGVSLLFLSVALVCVIRFVPAENVRIINQHKEQQLFVVAWMIVFCIFLLVNSGLHNLEVPEPILIENQIVAPVAVLVGVYIVLFFSIKTGKLLEYKEQSEEARQREENERRYRASLDKDILSVIEVNFSKNKILSGFEEFSEQLGAMIYNYNDMLSFFTSKIVHSDDIREFEKYGTADAVVSAFERGETEISFDYRRLSPEGTYMWARLFMVLIKDAESGEIRGIARIRNIDDEKKRHLELQYKAERDSLSGLYNKGMTEKLITEYLLSGGNKAPRGVLFIIDIDDFKRINDCLGHIYGDAVLSERAESLRTIFRENDVVGRIGGDEFIVFMKGNSSREVIVQKANEIRKAFSRKCRDTQNEACTISSSIGIALCPKDGTSFEELYKNADTALYVSKSKGKDAFTLYDGSDFPAHEKNPRKEEPAAGTIQKSFKQNRIEYAFKMLYHSDNPIMAIHSMLELLTSHFHFDRGYIFETDQDGKTTSNTFEWCAEGVEPQIAELQKIPIEAVATATGNFYKSRMFILKSLASLSEAERAVLEPQGIKSMFQFGIFDGLRLLGFIGFDNCKNERVPDDDELDEIATICNIFSTFFVKQRTAEAAGRNLKELSIIMDCLDNFVYVINRASHKIIFANERGRNMIGKCIETEFCFCRLQGMRKPCTDCPVQSLTDAPGEAVSSDMYNSTLKKWFHVTAYNVEWMNGEQVCLVNCVDISQYRK